MDDDDEEARRLDEVLRRGIEVSNRIAEYGVYEPRRRGHLRIVRPMPDGREPEVRRTFRDHFPDAGAWVDEDGEVHLE